MNAQVITTKDRTKNELKKNLHLYGQGTDKREIFKTLSKILETDGNPYKIRKKLWLPEVPTFLTNHYQEFVDFDTVYQSKLAA